MYSCHPSGTMDAGFPKKDDLYQYAEYLPKLKAMGIDHVWLLPVFEHDAGGVYHSTDQGVIDPRYGGEQGCKYYCDTAHALGMTILFDYVPHGPAPEFPIARDNPTWPSKRRDGSLQDEWECVSMDYNHPGYQEYTAELVHDHVNRFGVDGARIDCAMGGLSNWRPYPGNRPSGNSVLAGVHITEAIREGFLRGGKPSFILPENFNPIPNYYHCTDLFYGMNLYRAFVDLEAKLHTDPAAFVEGLTDYLEREAWLFPANYHKMRFLGNHDTVSWVWQSKRAVDCYGTDGAKALFALIALLDGVPMLYQGDEDPTICGHDGENLTAYFTELLSARRRLLPRGSNRTEYLHTGTPVMAFLRVKEDVPPAPYQTEGEHSVWVLLNLSDAPQPIPAGASGKLLFDSTDAEASAPLAPWAYRILDAEV
jgi:glycosidase